MPDLRRHYRDVKKVLRKGQRVDSFFVGKYSFSPYQACAHGCLYCDGRAERYWVEGEFDRDIIIRRSVGVAAMPFLPYLADGDGDFEALASRLAEIGVDFALPGGLTLRPGRQKEIFFETLRRAFPDLTPRYEDLYGENRTSGAPFNAYARERQRRAEKAFVRAGIPVVVPHRLYRGRLPVYDEVDVLMEQMIRHYADHAEAVPRLKDARDRYCDWLIACKRVFNRSRRLREEDLAGELRTLASSARWTELLGNAKLAAFLREIIVNRRTFDEKTLRLS